MFEDRSGVVPPETHPSVPRKQLRLRRKGIFLTDAEFQLIDEAARLCGKTTGAFMREAALGVPLKAQPFLADAELIRELGRNGVALTRLAATARASGALHEADGLEAARLALLALIRQIESAHAAAATR